MDASAESASSSSSTSSSSDPVASSGAAPLEDAAASSQPASHSEPPAKRQKVEDADNAVTADAAPENEAADAAAAEEEPSAGGEAAVEAAGVDEVGSANGKGNGKEKGPKEKDEGASLAIPRNAVKRIMKLEDDVKQVQAEAILLVSKATELFIEKLAKGAHKSAVQGDRKQVKYDDLYSIREKDPNLNFLRYIIPAPKPADDDNEKS